jgi:membrane protein YdbS with pleckstrin-like domain
MTVSAPVPAPPGPPAAGPFDPAGVAWNPVQPQLVTVRWLAGGLTGLALAIAAAVLALAVGRPWLWSFVGLVVAVTAVSLVLVRRRVRSIGWALRERDLYVRRGRIFRRLTVVPYVRIQYVDLQAGPLDRAFGLTSLTVNTAAAGVAVNLPGLSPETAAQLREALTDKAKLEPAA